MVKWPQTCASNNSLKIHKAATDRTAGKNSSPIVVEDFNEAISSGRDSLGKKTKTKKQKKQRYR